MDDELRLPRSRNHPDRARNGPGVLTAGRRRRRAIASEASPDSLSAGPPTPASPVRVLFSPHDRPTLFPAHRHADEPQVLIPVRGVVRVETQDALWLVPTGKAIVIPAGCSHSVMAPGGTTMFAVLVHPSAFDPDPRCRMIGAGGFLHALLAEVASRPVDYEPHTPAARLVAVLMDQLQAAETHGFVLTRPRDARLRAIVDGLMADPADPRSLPAWGAAVGASERTLHRLFEAELGMGFRACRRLIQMQRALTEICAGRTPDVVAEGVGYESPSAFIKAFRTTFGVTPGDLKRRQRQSAAAREGVSSA